MFFYSIDEQNELDEKIHEYEQRKNGFSFDSVNNFTKKNFDTMIEKRSVIACCLNHFVIQPLL